MLQSRIYNLRETKVIRDLNPADINKLISVSGMVRLGLGVVCIIIQPWQAGWLV